MVSLRKIIKAIIAGERDPVKFCRLVHGRTRNKHGEQVITDSLSGVIQQADVEILIQSMEQLDLIEKQQATCLNHLEELVNTFFVEEILFLCTIPGIKIVSVMKACVRQESSDRKVFYFLKITTINIRRSFLIFSITYIVKKIYRSETACFI